jgi:hypothetical protein
MTLVTLAHGLALQAVWVRDSSAITLARTTFARAHGIAPSEVVVSIEYSTGLFDLAPTAAELITINRA